MEWSNWNDILQYVLCMYRLCGNCTHAYVMFMYMYMYVHFGIYQGFIQDFELGPQMGML